MKKQPLNSDRKGIVSTWLLAHPHSVGESYFEHQRAALRFAFILSAAAAAAFLHAIVPSMCQSTARQHIARLHDELHSRSGGGRS